MMEIYKFSDLFFFQRKSKIKAGDGSSNGLYPFFTSSPHLTKRYSEAQFDSASLIFGTGGMASVHFCYNPFSVSTDCLVAQPKKEFEIKFIYWFLRGNIKILESGFKGAGLRHISKKYIGDIQIPLPSLGDQKRIVRELDSADALRHKRTQAIALLDDYLKAVFLEMFGNLESNSKSLENCILKDLCEKIIDCPHSTPKYSDIITEYPCIRSSDLQNGFLDFGTTKYVEEDEYLERIKRGIPIEGDIIYCREGARFGNVGILLDDTKICLGQRTMLLRANYNKVTHEFLWGFLCSKFVLNQAQSLVIGAAAPHINVKDIKGYKAYLPPRVLQDRYSQIFHVVNKTKLAMIAQSEQLEANFNALIQSAFSS